MILFREQHEEVNVIHIIMGDESDFQLNMSGSIVLDLTDQLDSEKRNVLYINRCESETELQEQISYYQSQSNMKKIFTPEDKEEKVTKKKVKTSAPLNSKKSSGGEHGTFNKEMRCPKCNSWGTYVKAGLVTSCDVCRRIDEGLQTKDIPPIPREEEREDIVTDFFKKKENRQEDA